MKKFGLINVYLQPCKSLRYSMKFLPFLFISTFILTYFLVRNISSYPLFLLNLEYFLFPKYIHYLLLWVHGKILRYKIYSVNIIIQIYRLFLVFLVIII